MSNKLEEADELDVQAGLMSTLALKLRQEYLESKGWDINGQMVGPTISYIYKKGDYIGVCEFDALDHEEFQCCNAG